MGSCCWTMEQKICTVPFILFFGMISSASQWAGSTTNSENSELQILPKPLLNGSKNCWVVNEFPICNWVGSTTQPDFSRFLGFSLAAKSSRLDRVNGQDVNSIETWKARASGESREATWGHGGDPWNFCMFT